MRNACKILFITTMFLCFFSGAGADDNRSTVTGGIYYDMATGHKYVKNSDTTYTEFSKRGKLLRADVPSSLPLLASGKHIIEVTPDHYLLYEKKGQAGDSHLVRLAQDVHPAGWQCKQILSEVRASTPGKAEAYSSE